MKILRPDEYEEGSVSVCKLEEDEDAPLEDETEEEEFNDDEFDNEEDEPEEDEDEN